MAGKAVAVHVARAVAPVQVKPPVRKVDSVRKVQVYQAAVPVLHKQPQVQITQRTMGWQGQPVTSVMAALHKQLLLLGYRLKVLAAVVRAARAVIAKVALAAPVQSGWSGNHG
jgi:hypothetical protein